jgi:hypothetical protein
MEATQEEIDRFMSYVDKLPNGCWFWTGGRSRGKGNKKWYGSFWFRGKTIRAHRFSCDYLGKFEPLPPGQHRDHTCVFSLCVNFDHLEKVTPKENNDRKLDRTFCYGDPPKPRPAIFNGPRLRGPMLEAMASHASLFRFSHGN